MIRKRTLIIAAILVALVAFIVIFGRISPVKTEELSQAVDVPRSFTVSVPYKDDSLVTSNGRSFISYNYVTGKVNLVSPDSFVNGLTSVDTLTISDDEEYLLFHSELNTPGSAMYQALTATNQDTGQGHWWVYSIRGQTFRPLPADVVLAKFYKKQVHALRDNGTAESIATYDAGSLQQTQSINIPRSSDFLATEDGYLLQTSDEQISLTTDGVVSKTVATDSTTLVAYDADKNVLVGVKNMDDSQDLVEIKLSDFSSDVIAGDIINQAVAGGGKVTYTYKDRATEGTATIGIYDITTGISQAWDISKIQNEDKNILFSAAASLDDDNAILSSSTGSQFLVGNELADIKTPDPYEKLTVINGVQTSITYDSQSQTFVVYPPVTTASGMSVLYQELDKLGYNPYLYGVNFTPEGSD